MKVAKFTIEGEIKTKQRPRAYSINGHARMFTPKDTLYYENYVRECYKRQCKDIYFKDKPLEVEIIALFNPPKDYEKFLNNHIYVSCLKHKDLDNIAKIVLDSLNTIAFIDDKQVDSLVVKKAYCDPNTKERIEVRIVEHGTDEETAKKVYQVKKLNIKIETLKAIENPTIRQRKDLKVLEDKLKETGIDIW